MHAIEVILIMLLAVVISGYLVRLLPFSLPLPLIQIALGAIIAGGFQSGVTLDPAIFFLLFLPPLLFLDGWRIPKVGLMRDGVIIVELALGLVVFTVVGAGFLIHWLIPTIPLPVAFALAAVISPTDPVALRSACSCCSCCSLVARMISRRDWKRPFLLSCTTSLSAFSAGSWRRTTSSTCSSTPSAPLQITLIG